MNQFDEHLINADLQGLGNLGELNGFFSKIKHAVTKVVSKVNDIRKKVTPPSIRKLGTKIANNPYVQLVAKGVATMYGGAAAGAALSAIASKANEQRALAKSKAEMSRIDAQERQQVTAELKKMGFSQAQINQYFANPDAFVNNPPIPAGNSKTGKSILGARTNGDFIRLAIAGRVPNLTPSDVFWLKQFLGNGTGKFMKDTIFVDNPGAAVANIERTNLPADGKRRLITIIRWIKGSQLSLAQSKVGSARAGAAAIGKNNATQAAANNIVRSGGSVADSWNNSESQKIATVNAVIKSVYPDIYNKLVASGVPEQQAKDEALIQATDIAKKSINKSGKILPLIMAAGAALTLVN